jgi:DNA topoisomerase-1
MSEVIDALDDDLGRHFFPPAADGSDSRRCPGCGNGRLGLKLGKFGAFIGCSNYPECRFTRKLAISNGDDRTEAALAQGPIELGADPESGMVVTVRKGPYGPYIQLGDIAAGQKKEKPKRVSVPKGVEPATMTLETALQLLGLPRVVGPHPETSKPIAAGIGRFGAYVEHDGKYASLPDGEDVLMVGLNRAVDLLARAKSRRGAGGAQREIGVHPDDGKPVTIQSGRYGPYVRHGRTSASIPKDRDPDNLALADALALLASKKGRPVAKRSKGTASRPRTRDKRAASDEPSDA